MSRTLLEALEAIHGELLKIEFYGQAAEDNLERLQGTVRHVQRTVVDRIDHAIQLERELTRSVLRAIEAVIQSMLDRRARAHR